MKRSRSRFALIGVLALAICVTVGLMAGAADAKKKKSKKSFTVSKTAPTTIPGAPGPGGVVAKFPIGTVGKKAAKGKVVSLNGVNLTSTFSGAPGFASDIDEVDLIGPSGRVAFVGNPFPNGFPGTETVSGPLTETPNSAANACIPSATPPPPPCADPDATLGPPYAGTIGNTSLLNLSGSNPIGTWFLKVFRGSGTDPITVGNVTVTGGLITKPQ
jgi:hypothetical protein